MKPFVMLLLLIVAGVPCSYAEDNCTVIDNCQECVSAECNWVMCLNMPESCEKNPPPEMCQLISCINITTTVPTTTTTTSEDPTTTIVTTQPTTEPANETTTVTTIEPTTDVPTDPTTTVPVTHPTPTTVEPSTTTSEIPTSTEPSTTVPTSTPAPCPGHHFDAGSFFGGIFLAIGVLVVSYAGFRFYRARNGRSYNQLQETVHM